jgi:hypothetical protein
MKKQTAFLALAILSLLLSGWTLRPPAVKAEDRILTLRVTTTVRPSGSGTVKLELTPSPGLTDFLNSEHVPGDPFCHTVESYVSTGFNFTTTYKNSSFQCIGTASFQGLEELESLMDDNLGSNTVQRLEIEEDRFYYEARIDIDVSSLSSSDFSVEVFWMLVLPGTPGENNADTVSGRTLTWDLSNSYGSSFLSAESAIGGSFLGMDSSMLAIIMVLMMSCCCVIVLIAAGIVAFLVLRKNNPSTTKESSADKPILGS